LPTSSSDSVANSGGTRVSYAGAGGGGTSSAGGSGSGSGASTNGGVGGSGLTNDISGTDVVYGTGGDGGEVMLQVVEQKLMEQELRLATDYILSHLLDLLH
jgi:hypothetical protein